MKFLSPDSPAGMRLALLAVVFLIPWTVLEADAQTGAAQTIDDLVYTLPPGWVFQPVQAGPEVKAHYAFYYGGVPCGELYISQEILSGPQTVDQFFQAGLAKVRPTLPYYQARGTQKINLAGLETLVHEFSYALAGTMFIGRTYVLVVNGKGYSFFFQTVSNYFSSVQQAFAQVMSTVKTAVQPAPAPGPSPRPAPSPGAGMTVEELGMIMKLPAGWGLSGDTAGAKYRMANANGRHIASLVILEADWKSGLLAMDGVPMDKILDVSLRNSKEGTFDTFQNYAPLETAKRKIAGLEGLVHDFTCEQSGQKVFYRWCLVAMKNKPDTESVKYAARVERFAFMAWDMDQLEEFKAGFKAVIDSMRPK